MARPAQTTTKLNREQMSKNLRTPKVYVVTLEYPEIYFNIIVEKGIHILRLRILNIYSVYNIHFNFPEPKLTLSHAAWDTAYAHYI